MSEKYQIIRARRKSIGIKVNPDGTVTVRAPYRASDREIADCVEKHVAWIEKTKKNVTVKTDMIETLSAQEIMLLTEYAKKTLAEKLDRYTRLMGVSPTGVTITGARRRFGSCSSKKAVCFSLYLMLYPDEAIDYVVVHELSHLTEMNHSDRFYAIVEKYMPDWKRRKELLRPENMRLPADLNDYN